MNQKSLTMRPTSKEVSQQMSRMPTKDSKPEIKLRKALYSEGLRYRIHRKDLPGKPDISFGPARVAVFVDGCYWHNCPEHGTIPKSNSEWWKEKFQRNQERDSRNDALLREMGWLPIHVWEHEAPDEAACKIGGIVKRRIDGSYRTS